MRVSTERAIRPTHRRFLQSDSTTYPCSRRNLGLGRTSRRYGNADSSNRAVRLSTKVPRRTIARDFLADILGVFSRFSFLGSSNVASKVVVCKCGVDGWSIPPFSASWQIPKTASPALIHPTRSDHQRRPPKRGPFSCALCLESNRLYPANAHLLEPTESTESSKSLGR